MSSQAVHSTNHFATIRHEGIHVIPLTLVRYDFISLENETLQLTCKNVVDNLSSVHIIQLIIQALCIYPKYQ